MNRVASDDPMVGNILTIRRILKITTPGDPMVPKHLEILKIVALGDPMFVSNLEYLQNLENMSAW